MNANKNLWLLATVVFAGGFLSGLLFAPDNGRATRRRLADQARRPGQWVGGRLHGLERQLETLERQLHATTAEFGQRLHEATDQAVDYYLPGVPEQPGLWDLDKGDMRHDLRRMPC